MAQHANGSTSEWRVRSVGLDGRDSETVSKEGAYIRRQVFGVDHYLAKKREKKKVTAT